MNTTPPTPTPTAPISWESHPDNDKVVDAFLSSIYEMESFNYFANEYALSVVHYYFDNHELFGGRGFDTDWYNNWIQTEEFRDAPLSATILRVYEKMYDLYWDARGEWFDIMISNINAQNLRERNRSQYLHTLARDQSWEEFSKAAQAAPRVDHNLKED